MTEVYEKNQLAQSLGLNWVGKWADCKKYATPKHRTFPLACP